MTDQLVAALSREGWPRNALPFGPVLCMIKDVIIQYVYPVLKELVQSAVFGSFAFDHQGFQAVHDWLDTGWMRGQGSYFPGARHQYVSLSACIR